MTHKFDPITLEILWRRLVSIVDEADSVLIDEARTPLIISGPAEESTEMYYIINGIIPYLTKDKHYTIDEKTKSAVLTDEGVINVEHRLNIKNLYDPQNINILHHVNQALRAHALFKKDVDYVVKNDEVIIVDEFTGLSRKVIMESKDPELRPRISIKDEKGRTMNLPGPASQARYLLPVGANIFITDPSGLVNSMA
jgi:preprotein translocase subunit SecA